MRLNYILSTFLAAGCGLAATACTAPGPAASRSVTVRAIGDNGDPVANVAVALNGRELGATDEDGQLHVRLRGRLGAVFVPVARCPPPSESPENLPSITLRGRDADEPLVVDIACRRDSRLVGVVVRARKVQRETVTDDEFLADSGERRSNATLRKQTRQRLRRAMSQQENAAPLANVPILLRGQKVGETDALGNAHLAIHVAAHNRFELALDPRAAGHDAVAPARPVAHFAVGGTGDLFIFDQLFVEEVEPPEPPPAPPRKRKRPRKSSGPVVDKHRIKVIRGGERQPLVELDRPASRNRNKK